MNDLMFSALAPVVEEFHQLRIPYFIGGSVAVAYYGSQRQTNDVDMVADIHLHHARILAEHLKTAYYVDASMIVDAIKHQSSFNFIHLSTGFKIDVFILKAHPYHQLQMQRARSASASVNALPFIFATPEDIIIAKLDWYQRGGQVSTQQWNDILFMLQNHVDGLDLGYLYHWTQALKLGDLFDQAFDHIVRPPP